MGIEQDELRKKLTPGVITEILGDNWRSHDARWFLKVSAECGFDMANKLNKSTLKSMARTEMRRLLEATDCGEIRNVEDLVKLIDIALDVYFPSWMFDWTTKVSGIDSLTGTVTTCYVFEEVKKAGGAGTYECACGCRLEGWLAACGLTGDVRIRQSLVAGDPICEVTGTSIARSGG